MDANILGKEATMQPPELSPLEVFLSCFTISALGGFFSLLRSERPISLRSCCAATFYSGVIGLVIGLLWYNYWADTNIFFLIGVSGLAGLGGLSLSDLVIKLLRGKLGIKISVHADKED
jgi:hypothetical protein